MWEKKFAILLMKEEILMRVLFCKIHCPFMCLCKPSNAHIYTSGPIKLENTPQHFVSSTAVADAASESDDSSCYEAKEEALNVNEEKSVVVLKSCVRKIHSESDVTKEKKRISWVDDLGKELAEVKEFESSETRYDYEGNSCLCVIL